MIEYVSLLMGALIGFLGSIGFFFVQELWNSHTVTKLLNTEISLILKSIDGIIPSLNDAIKSTESNTSLIEIPTPKLDTLFYENLIGKMSLLNTQNIADIKMFYFLVDMYQYSIEKAISSKNKQTTNAWFKKALDTLTYAKDLGNNLTSKLKAK